MLGIDADGVDAYGLPRRTMGRHGLMSEGLVIGRGGTNVADQLVGLVWDFEKGTKEEMRSQRLSGFQCLEGSSLVFGVCWYRFYQLTRQSRETNEPEVSMRIASSR